MQLQDSKTFQNLHAAFAGETQARSKYTYYAGKARKDGYEQIADIFEETAKNELAHAKLWFELIVGGIKETGHNLADAQAGEQYEWSEMYAEFARVAREEGFSDIARRFEMVANVEKAHDSRYGRLLENVRAGKVFAREQTQEWVCRNCGHIHRGKEAPAVCPLCAHPGSYFELQAQNY
ncbi:MAG: rubrerythrin family protein [Christensenellaceae bacterium]|nr:rubrerythrin family protein [Christensenellaceae bacterium]